MALEKLPFTNARSNLSNIFDRVINHQEPVVVSRRNEDVLLIKRDIQKAMLACYSVNVDVLPDSDGSLTLAVDELEIVVNADTQDAAITDLVDELKLYANDYFTRLPLFLNAPNRKAHLPIVLRVLLAEDDDEIKSILNLSGT